MTYALMRWSLATRVPYRELVAMDPALLATLMLAHRDLNATPDEPLEDLGE